MISIRYEQVKKNCLVGNHYSIYVAIQVYIYSCFPSEQHHSDIQSNQKERPLMQEVVKNITSTIQQAQQQTTPKLTLPDKNMSVGELSLLLNVLAAQYKTTLPALLRKLDRVSGHLGSLDRCYVNDEETLEWTPDEDELLNTNEQLLKRWKGQESVERRKTYLLEKRRGQAAGEKRK